MIKTLLFLLISLTWGCNGDRGVKIGDMAPPFDLPGYSGTDLHCITKGERVRLLYFRADWCPRCEEDFQPMERFCQSWQKDLKEPELIAVNMGHSFPIVSLPAPANHHDSHFLPFMVKLAQAMGIDLQLITADEAYHDKDGTLFQETGVKVTTPSSSKVSLPEHIKDDTLDVFCHGACSIPMHHLGVEKQIHEYKCSADADECTLLHFCPQCRFIPLDGGLFQRITYHADGIRKVHDIRKNCERPFNLLKNQTGLETVRVRSQPSVMADVHSVLLVCC